MKKRKSLLENAEEKKTPEEEQARKEKRKKALAGVGKWILRTIVSIGTMLLMYYIFSLLRK